MSEVEISKFLKGVTVTSAIRFYTTTILFVVTICGLYYAIKTDITGVKTDLSMQITNFKYSINKKVDSIDAKNALIHKDMWQAIKDKTIVSVPRQRKRQEVSPQGCLMERIINGKRMFIPVSCN